LTAALFAQRPAVYCHIVDCDGRTGGFALWFVNFSTWTGVHGIYLEDLYVRPELPGLGLGKARLQALAELCLARGLRPPGVVGPRLERARPGLLPRARRAGDAGVDRPSRHGGRPPGTGAQVRVACGPT
jgi:GNAT superfamily N-acetyltransferase